VIYFSRNVEAISRSVKSFPARDTGGVNTTAASRRRQASGMITVALFLLSCDGAGHAATSETIYRRQHETKQPASEFTLDAGRTKGIAFQRQKN